jgi:hypothetical protein
MWARASRSCLPAPSHLGLCQPRTSEDARAYTSNQDSYRLFEIHRHSSPRLLASVVK